jgi:malate dehydrogenase (oxaloacetate-decarboxylating)(NADP+)
VPLTGIEIVDLTADADRLERYAQQYYRARQRKGVTEAEARERVRNPVTFGCMMVREDDADGLVAGEEMHYPDTIRPALEVIGTSPHVEHVAGLYMMVLEDDLVFFADTTVNIEPTPEQLAQIGYAAARIVRSLGIEPRVAMLSFSNFGSVRHPEAEKVARAVTLLRSRDPSLIVDGEMQADTALY